MRLAKGKRLYSVFLGFLRGIAEAENDFQM